MSYSFSLAQRENRPARAPDTSERRLTLPLVVDERDVLRVRKAAIQNSGGRVEIVRCVPIRKSTKVRLTIEFQAGALEETMHHVMRSIAAGEFGRIGLAL
jgi:hypothetical protein